MEKKISQSWMTFEKKIAELEMQKSNILESQMKFQEEIKLTIIDALIRNDFDSAIALTQEIKEQQHGQIVTLEERVNFLKDRQQKIRELPDRDQEYHESLLKDDPLYMHALETDDTKTIELFRQRKISEELYQKLRDAYYSTHFNVWKDEESVHEKVKPKQSNQNIKDILKEMNIWYDIMDIDDFYEPENQKGGKTLIKKPSISIHFIKEWNIIKELLEYLQTSQIAFNHSDIILNKKWTTMYMYIQWINKTVVVSNVYGVWTHIYKGKIDIQEMQSSTINLLCGKYKGKKINFWLNYWWIDGWKDRLKKTLHTKIKEDIEQKEKELIEILSQEIQPTKQEDNVIPPKTATISTQNQEEQNNGNGKKRFGSLREKIDDFSASKKDITHKTISFDKTYPGIVTSIIPSKDFPWRKVYVNIGKDVFGYYISKNPEDIKKIKLWDIVTVKAKRIYLKGKSIFFQRT